LTGERLPVDGDGDSIIVDLTDPNAIDEIEADETEEDLDDAEEEEDDENEEDITNNDE